MSIEIPKSPEVRKSDEQILLNQGRRPEVLVPDTDAAGNYVKGERPATPMASEVAKREIQTLRAEIDKLNGVVDRGTPTEKAQAVLQLSQKKAELRRLEANYDKSFFKETYIKILLELERILLLNQESSLSDSASPTSSGFGGNSSIPGERPVASDSVTPDTGGPSTLTPSETSERPKSSLAEQQLRFVEANREMSKLKAQLNATEDPVEWGKVNQQLKTIKAKVKMLRVSMLGSADKTQVN